MLPNVPGEAADPRADPWDGSGWDCLLLEVGMVQETLWWCPYSALRGGNKEWDEREWPGQV